ncbi:hypothetical protein KY316_01135 [Candidatus Woesearchaeota archaeon]|nr:hypothetical protein [Candidatus Woesearchaeota archaeon]
MKKLIIASCLVLLLLSLMACDITQTDEANIKIKKLDKGVVHEVDIPSDVPVVLIVNKDNEGYFVPADGETYLLE